MHSFVDRMGNDAVESGKKGWLVAILELGAWVGVLVTGASFHNSFIKRAVFACGTHEVA